MNGILIPEYTPDNQEDFEFNPDQTELENNRRIRKLYADCCNHLKLMWRKEIYLFGSYDICMLPAKKKS